MSPRSDRKFSFVVEKCALSCYIGSWYIDSIHTRKQSVPWYNFTRLYNIHKALWYSSANLHTGLILVPDFCCRGTHICVCVCVRACVRATATDISITSVFKHHVVIRQSLEYSVFVSVVMTTPDSKVYGANMGRVWGRQDPGWPHVGPMNLAIWDHKEMSDCIHLQIYSGPLLLTYMSQLWFQHG